MTARKNSLGFRLAAALAFALLAPQWLASQGKPKIQSTPEWIKLPPDVAATHLIKKVPPAYPAFAKAAGIQGVVTVGVAIYPDGHIHAITARSGGWACLGEAAMTAAGGYIYRPFKKGGRLVGVETTEDIVFSLPNSHNVFQPPPAPQITLDSLEGFRDAIPVVDGPSEVSKWVLSQLQKDFTYSFWAKRGGFAGLKDQLPAKMVEIPTKSPASRIYLVTDKVISPNVGNAVLCGGTGNCDIWLVEDDAGVIHQGIRSGGYGFYARPRKDSPFPDIFIASNMSASETDVGGYVNVGGYWGLLYCGTVEQGIYLCR